MLRTATKQMPTISIPIRALNHLQWKDFLDF